LSKVKKNRNRSSSPRRKVAHPLSRQREQKPISQPRMLARERILTQLHDLIVACEELFEEHGEACDCEACCVVSNMVGSVRVFRLILEIS
jgi:hypothetical protein